MPKKEPPSNVTEPEDEISSRSDENTASVSSYEILDNNAGESSITDKQAIKNAKNKKDFLIGLMICAGVNAIPILIFPFLLFLATMNPYDASDEINLLVQFGKIWLIANLIILIIIAILRREFLKGMVAGYAMAFFFTLVSGLFLSAFCLSLR